MKKCFHVTLSIAVSGQGTNKFLDFVTTNLFFCSIGDSVGSRTIYAIKLSVNNEVRKLDPVRVSFVAGTHANDRINTELLLQFVANLCKNYKKDFFIKNVSSSVKLRPFLSG